MKSSETALQDSCVNPAEPDSPFDGQTRGLPVYGVYV